VGKVLRNVFLLSEYKDDKDVAADVILTLANLIVRNEICQTVAQAGGLTFIMDVFVDYLDNEVKGSRICV
jgi:hypothetical protein